MANCLNCGTQLPENARFCSECGLATAVFKPSSLTTPATPQPVQSNQPTTTQQTQTPPTAIPISVQKPREEEVRKCPHCGDPIDAFEVKCDACGYEFHSLQTSEAINKLSYDLQKTSSPWQRATIVSSFSIPNTKSEIFDFMSLALTYVELAPQQTEVDVWVSKADQCYQKAKSLFTDKKELSIIEDTYASIEKKSKKNSEQIQNRNLKKLFKNTMMLWIAAGLFLVAFFLDIFTFLNTSILHLGGGVLLIVAGIDASKKDMECITVGAGVSAGVVLLGMILQSLWHNGSMMVVMGVATLIICGIGYFKNNKSGN